MFRGLWKLTWLEIKIFLREPLGAFGSILFPVLVSLPPGSYALGCRFSRLCRSHSANKAETDVGFRIFG